MRSYRYVVLALCVVAVLLDLSGISFARDRGGCLTCHQYPGLVRSGTGSDPKILHIDEGKYAQSPHGKLPCQKCHIHIDKIPHTGESRVTCDVQCHQSVKDKQMLQTYDYSLLHQKEQSYIKKMDDLTSCRVCHPLSPHRKNKLVRGLLNMHIGFMYCEACHIDREKVESLTYGWHRTEHVDFVGEAYGTWFKPRIVKVEGGEHALARIAVLHREKGEDRLRINTWDLEKAREYLKVESSLSLRAKKEQLAYFHQDIAKKEISVACEECHSEHSILDFKKLGFSEKKARDLITINLKGLVEKYKTFYLPHIFPQ